mmetsp:Transcript_94858/g.244941  ORF Transcript_94858/g.244941 Transcript_94858/m.244941 type:complete len:224 (-) Transcript_94858:344-1015(-)
MARSLASSCTASSRSRAAAAVAARALASRVAAARSCCKLSSCILRCSCCRAWRRPLTSTSMPSLRCSSSFARCSSWVSVTLSTSSRSCFWLPSMICSWFCSRSWSFSWRSWSIWFSRAVWRDLYVLHWSKVDCILRSRSAMRASFLAHSASHCAARLEVSCTAARAASASRSWTSSALRWRACSTSASAARRPCSAAASCSWWAMASWPRSISAARRRSSTSE